MTIQNKYKYQIIAMSKYCLVLMLLIAGSLGDNKSTACKLTVYKSPGQESLIGKSIQIYPAVYSSPVDNLNNQVFTIVKAEPIDACTRLAELDPKIGGNEQQNPYLIVIDGDSGYCGFRRRIQMAKEAGAKGIIILNQKLDNAIDPYGDYNDNTFLVFIAQSTDSKSVLLPEKYIIATLSTSSSRSAKSEIQFWISTLDTKSYELLALWQQTIAQIPAIKNKLNWKPRFALWGCNSGLFTPGSACLNDPQYISTCACGGQFCSPETKQKAADANVKQDIRQKIIFTNYGDKYLPYVTNFTKNCLKEFQKSNYAEDCATSIMMNLNIDYIVLQQKLDAFMTKCSGDIYETLLLDRNRFSQLGYYPIAVLDRQPIDFSSKRDFQIQLCRKLSLQKQQGCAKVMKVNTIINVTVNILFFILIVGGLAAVVAILVLIYNKTIRKQMHKEMKMQVAASVEHYFALTQTK